MLHVPRAAVSLVGGIQPGVLRTAIGREHMQDGLCAWLLMAMPEPRPVRWSEATIPPAVEAAMGKVFDKLLSMEPAADAEGTSEPFPLDLTAEAKDLWVRYFNRHRAELADLDDDLAAAWSKLEAYTARFALVFQLCSWAAGDAGGDAVDESSMGAAIELSDWFGGEARCVYGLFVESDGDREQRELIELVRRKDGSATARELMRSCRRFGTSAEAEAALDALAKAGAGHWMSVPSGPLGGKPTRRFQLADAADVDDTSLNRGGSGGSVNVNGVNGLPTHGQSGAAER